MSKKGRIVAGGGGSGGNGGGSAGARLGARAAFHIHKIIRIPKKIIIRIFAANVAKETEKEDATEERKEGGCVYVGLGCWQDPCT